MIKYNKEIKINSWVLGPGYLCFTDKEHPLVNKNGEVYYHRHIASLKIGRWLTSEECVHHIDGDIENNKPENFKIMTLSEHAKLHAPEIKEKICSKCGKTFKPKRNRIKFCSYECANKAQKRFEVSKEELEKLVWQMSTIKVAEIFNVSDVAIAKRCKKLGIKKPGRGYWAKQYASVAQVDRALDS